MKNKVYNINDIFDKAYNEESLTYEEIKLLLELKDKEGINTLLNISRHLRNKYFGNKIFFYGFIYFSTFCKNNCLFCKYRKSNTLTNRYRKTNNEIMEVVYQFIDSGVHLIDLTMGEDPYYHINADAFRFFTDLVEKIKNETSTAIMVSPGVVSQEILQELAHAGIDWYACYQETHNRKLFKYLRPFQDYNLRLNAKILAAQLGLLIEEGILTGVGESFDDIIMSMKVMKQIKAHQVRVMSFIPQKGTPMEKIASPERTRELKIIAVLRILFPTRLIPASLDIDGIKGIEKRLEAGANVITSLILPNSGLLGVSNPTLNINDGGRTVKNILPILDRLELRAADQEEYLEWIRREKIQLCKDNQG